MNRRCRRLRSCTNRPASMHSWSLLVSLDNPWRYPVSIGARSVTRPQRHTSSHWDLAPRALPTFLREHRCRRHPLAEPPYSVRAARRILDVTWQSLCPGCRMTGKFPSSRNLMIRNERCVSRLAVSYTYLDIRRCHTWRICVPPPGSDQLHKDCGSRSSAIFRETS